MSARECECQPLVAGEAGLQADLQAAMTGGPAPTVWTSGGVVVVLSSLSVVI